MHCGSSRMRRGLLYLRFHLTVSRDFALISQPRNIVSFLSVLPSVMCVHTAQTSGLAQPSISLPSSLPVPPSPPNMGNLHGNWQLGQTKTHPSHSSPSSPSPTLCKYVPLHTHSAQATIWASLHINSPARTDNLYLIGHLAQGHELKTWH